MFGSKLGWLTIAMTAPVRGSITTALPRSDPSTAVTASSTDFWKSMSIVRTMSWAGSPLRSPISERSERELAFDDGQASAGRPGEDLIRPASRPARATQSWPSRVGSAAISSAVTGLR